MTRHKDHRTPETRERDARAAEGEKKLIRRKQHGIGLRPDDAPHEVDREGEPSSDGTSHGEHR